MQPDHFFQPTIGVPSLLYAIRGPRHDPLDDIDEDDLEDDDH